MTAITFTVPGPLRGKGRPRFGNGRTFTDSKTMTAEAFVRSCAALACPLAPIDGPVSLDIRITRGIPKSWPNKRRQAALQGRLHATGKPDLDNVVKLVGDALNGIIWRDDSQITSVTCSRHFGEVEQSVISIQSLEAS
ncbi:RusA family crossover junction endodeoxyribonuclease [Komagataeibacter sp. FNDCF1]|uniref:RusA family crossover junction endodeoxyribonuclease n=1 Tax=Komagataeibacter sp. FNDCF1 TaxID=2878681 RepID=UPI001E390F8E|nr:RusA family crossover junction endodeoxyribonuclease [Komagataeibacter sp. FNDCF1]MCE2563360.1 RusA family crossover junction endodeoxyribonuclease [Komagataeibacter sp. FNDCF1]